MSKSGSKIREQVAHFLVDIHKYAKIVKVAFTFANSHTGYLNKSE